MPGEALAATPAPRTPFSRDDIAPAAKPEQASADVIARVLIEGFDRHYALFRDCAKAAKRDFEAGNWLAIGHLTRERIDFYDRRVAETVERIERDFAFSADDAFWAKVKQQFVALLAEHRQPECAETFFNTVSTKLLHRTYFHNRCLFVRPAASTEYLDDGAPSYRCYYPRRLGLRATLIDVVLDFGLRLRFADFRADLRNVLGAMRQRLPRPFVVDANCQIQVLSSLLFRNQTAYAVGRVVNAEKTYPFVAAIKRRSDDKLYVDALLSDPLELALLFSANRAYFLVDMEVPSAYVEFLRPMLPDKTTSELYTMLGLQKHGKTLFYRDFLHHLKHSTDRLVAAPGIRGLVMSVFTLPSYPYVFKVIRDRIAPSKDTDAARVQAKYALVKHHDRAGRMTDTLEYSDVAIPRGRFTDALLAELEATIASRLELDDDYVIIRHVYIERRLTPLNLFVTTADDAATMRAMRDYGNALKELAAVNIFPGDLLFKNFGVTRYGRVVFYDYDEIEYLTDCRFRAIPARPPDVDELSDEVWHPVGPHDVFPEEFARFLLTDASIRRAFVACHSDLLDAAWWQAMQEANRGGAQIEVLSYPESVRFKSAAATPPSRALLAS
ncbi:MAG TPA: bifunctional isocitrate dehydrogenase kinase/phosphatase [Casimicrobiaceae bacterium]|nr:bifunctional isocitrate dehydrogenase kinase/phosphatase [Casimicrobiaceae bacterium]